VGPKERKEREKAERRDEIIRAGEALFLEKGLAGTTMDDIAKKAELSKGTLYLYFKSKEELYLTITHRAMSVLYEFMKNSQENTTGTLERIRNFGKSYFEFFEAYPNHFKILSVVIDLSRFFKQELKEIGHSIQKLDADTWGLITKNIEDGIKEGLFRENIDPLEIVISLWAGSNSLIHMMDYVTRNKELLAHHDDPFLSLDYRKIIINNGRRIIYSILKNPPPDFDSLEKIK
jgi:TetR/AcrR family transcriptional regulator